MKKLKKLYLREAVILGAVLFVLMIVGTVWDLPISKFMYPGHENTFGQIFAAFGRLPAFAGLVAGGVLLLSVRNRLRAGFTQWLALAGALVLIFGGIALCAKEAVSDISAMPLWVALLVTVFVSGAYSFGLLMLTRSCPTKTVIRFIGATLFAIVASFVFVELVKAVWGRPRMLLISTTGNESLFQPWYHPNGALKKRLLAEGVEKDLLSSFPSGHACSAACAMLLILLPTLGKQTRGRERAFLLLGAGWTLLVCFTRIMMGAHFLTDVTFACIVELLFSILGIKLFYFTGSFFRWFWNLIAEPQKNMDGQE